MNTLLLTLSSLALAAATTTSSPQDCCKATSQTAVTVDAEGGIANNPVADPRAVVQQGNARFTVLTDRLIRMEWAEDGQFEDRASLAIVNRNLPVPDCKLSRNGDAIQIKTPYVTLRYSGNGEKFTAENLSVRLKVGGRSEVWYPGKPDTGNLLGTARTLDGIEALENGRTLKGYHWDLSDKSEDLENGILSRDGWAIVDESKRPLFTRDDSSWGSWVDERPEGDRLDLYIFAYGHDYTAALADFSKVAGKVPMPPKYAFGYWWSRYWAYTDEEMLEIASELRENEVPADVFIVDMDWHLTWRNVSAERGNQDEFDQWIGWTGYSWDHSLIRNPEGFIYDLHKMDYKVALNLHPASGVRPYEDAYHDFVDDYLSRTDDYDGPKNYIYGSEPYTFAGTNKPAGKEGYAAPVPYRMDQQAWADAYFAQVIRPLERQGVDFWWLDWQQWMDSRYVKGLSNTFWINRAFFGDKVRQSASLGAEDADRPFTYHRWGGLGSHRYPLGFSGDVYDEWSALEMLPFFTSTASNVGYGYWGHDIGGHQQKQEHLTDPEMFTRWLQFGVFTPIFKTHSTASASLERRIWMYPTHFEYMKEAIDLRYALTPYIYTAAREAYDSGVCICRPMYYAYPESQNAYDFTQQYMFGDRIIASVICSPADENGKSVRKVWLPAGNDWYDMGRHTLVSGGAVRTFSYAIDENPWFVKAGSILPLAAEGIQNLQDKSNSLRLLVVPGVAKSSYTLYEDDEVSQAYTSQFATTLISKKGGNSSVSIEIAAREGSYKGMSTDRQFTIVLEGWKSAPSKVLVNGARIAAETRIGEHGVDVVLPESSASETLKVELYK